MESHELKGNYLLVDAAGLLVQTGVWRNGQWLEWHGSREEAGRSLFVGVQTLFASQGLSLSDLSGFFFCEGPGSMLGIRMAAMAIRGWQALLPSPLPVYAYRSHDVLAKLLLARRTAPPFHVLSDARRNRWNVTSVTGEGNLEPLRRLSSEELALLKGGLYRMEEIVRAEPPAEVSGILPYSLQGEAKLFLDKNLLRQTSTFDPLVQEAPEYKKWNAERHR